MTVPLTLYHFTAPYREGHLGAILRDGVILTTESNVSRRREHAGPPVVWLTDDPDPTTHAGWAAQNTVKLDGRITVQTDASKTMRWASFCVAQRVKPTWQSQLASAGGAHSWYVATAPIPTSRWVAVERRVNGVWTPIAGEDDLPPFVDLVRASGLVPRIARS
jgi:hypothetical protein